MRVRPARDSASLPLASALAIEAPGSSAKRDSTALEAASLVDLGQATETQATADYPATASEIPGASAAVAVAATGGSAQASAESRAATDAVAPSEFAAKESAVRAVFVAVVEFVEASASARSVRACRAFVVEETAAV